MKYDKARVSNTVKEWKERRNTKDSQYSNLEEKEIITTTEQIAARKHGDIDNDQVTRTSHGGKVLKHSVKSKTPYKTKEIAYGNAINGICPQNKYRYEEAAKREFGE